MRAPLALTALCAVLVGCGFAPQDEFTGRRIGDGVAPWENLGAVQLCIGNDRVGPPSSEPGGMCSAVARTEAPCLSDSGCRSRETCVCGRCTVQYCTAHSDCAPDMVCQFGSVDGNRCVVPCTRTSDCADGEVCQQPRCVARCDADGDCQTGEFCATIGLRRQCAVRACAQDEGCQGDAICRVQRRPRVAHEPSVLAGASAAEPAFAMWLELSDDQVLDDFAIYRAESRDGVRYRVNPASPVLDDPDGARAPSVIRTGAGLLAYYATADRDAVRVAASADGVQFSEPTTVLTAAEAGVPAIGAPGAVVLPGGDVAVYYEVGDGASIDWASGAPGGALTPRGTALTPAMVQTAPPAEPAAPFWLDITAVRSPHAAVRSGESGAALQLWYSAFGRESGDSVQLGQVVPIAPNASIGYASADPAEPGTLTLWPFNPVFDRIQVFVEHLSELAPAVVRDDERFLLYYVGADATGTALDSLGVAQNGE